MTGILLKPFRPERLLTRRDALLVVVQHFLDRARLLFGQQHIGVGAQRRDFEGLPGQRDTLAATGRFPGLIHDVLRGVGRVARTPPAEKTCHEPFHAAPVRQGWQSIVIFRLLGFSHCLLSGLLRYRHFYTPFDGSRRLFLFKIDPAIQIEVETAIRIDMCVDQRGQAPIVLGRQPR